MYHLFLSRPGPSTLHKRTKFPPRLRKARTAPGTKRPSRRDKASIAPGQIAHCVQAKPETRRGQARIAARPDGSGHAVLPATKAVAAASRHRRPPRPSGSRNRSRRRRERRVTSVSPGNRSRRRRERRVTSVAPGNRSRRRRERRVTSVAPGNRSRRWDGELPCHGRRTLRGRRAGGPRRLYSY